MRPHRVFAFFILAAAPLFAQPANELTHVKTGVGLREVVVRAHPVLVNQVGYDPAAPKRFTAPLTPDGTDFTIVAADTPDKPLFSGKVQGGVGDFTAFAPSPAQPERRYLVRVAPSGELPAGESDPFSLVPDVLRRRWLEPAIRFWTDARSVAGTASSAFGGNPWRDGIYYDWAMPSLVLLWQAASAEASTLSHEIDATPELARLTAPGFTVKRERGETPDELAEAHAAAKFALEAIRDHVRPDAPDLVKQIVWGTAWILHSPVSKDPSQKDDVPALRPQGVGQLAFFLEAYPSLAPHVSRAFYDRVRDFTSAKWDEARLFGVFTQIGDGKGREAPGHSIWPNLLMAEVAQRENQPDLAARHLAAAVAQAEWILKTFKPGDPRINKGQRMSEWKLLPALVRLQTRHAGAAPAALRPWLAEWTRITIARSANTYDLRHYDDSGKNWTLPGWMNEPGNIAGTPALCLAALPFATDEAARARLREIAWAHFDNLAGRNPMAAHASFHATDDYPGVTRGWVAQYKPGGTVAHLEDVRGALTGTPGSDHYPYNPTHKVRHPEGWTAHNAALNVALAYALSAQSSNR